MNIDDEIIKMRRHLHQYPEISDNEFNTAKYIESKLTEFKIPFKRVRKTGVIGLITTGKPGKTIALRTDMDALPIEEQNSVRYKSKKRGLMHACGHDGHIAIILGAAKILSQTKNSLKGNIKFIFQPAEEESDGALGMIREGALENPKVDIILGMHLNPQLPCGKIAFKYGAMMASSDKFTITIDGLIAHGAQPHKGKDALIAATELVSSCQTIISRELNPILPAVLTFGKIYGGDAYNVICKSVVLIGTARALDSKVRAFIKLSIIKKMKALEISAGVKCKMVYEPLQNQLFNNPKITKLCIESAKEFYGIDNVLELSQPSMGGEDFADYLEKVPGNFAFIGSAKDKNTAYPWHHNRFNIDESVLPKAAKYMAYTAQKLLDSVVK
ncbi:MAG: amidohydrolase [Elusimicrobiota bacterium]|jgi:amidohydrolase|nr:amidohydrolase [Elusimicrobiota bacterium]